MPAISNNALRLGRVAGVDLYLHWWWFLFAVYEIAARRYGYSNILWNVLEYLALFVVVLLHEFGHVLACRSTGGTADRIMLWPLGGVAYVNPPQRPGAILWSIVAGPLVNVALFVVFLSATFAAAFLGLRHSWHDAYHFLAALAWMNLALLAFNLLPVYPLDGGKILQSLLWFVMGRARSLQVVAFLGFFGVVGLVGLAIYLQSIWTGLIAFFVATNCMAAFKQAKLLLEIDRRPRRPGFACPACHTAFDTFQTGGVCPNCGLRFEKTACDYCGKENPIREWVPGAVAGVGVVNGGTAVQ